MFDAIKNWFITLFKKPVSYWIQETNLDDWTIFGLWLDTPISYEEFENEWLPKHCLLYSEDSVWPEEYKTFMNQYSFLPEQFRIGMIRKEGNKFLVFDQFDTEDNEVGEWENLKQTYIFNTQMKIWEPEAVTIPA